MLVDSGMCVAMPILMPAKALNYHCPGVKLNPPSVDNPWVKDNGANGSITNIIGTLDVFMRFSGLSVKANLSEGLAMVCWFTTTAAIFTNQSKQLIMLTNPPHSRNA